MRIAYVTETYPPEVNGVALTVERTVAHLRRHQGPVCLIRPRQHGETERDDEHEWRTAGAPIPMYPALRFGWASAAAVRQRLDAFGPDLVHVATPGPLGHAAVRAARRLRLPVTSDFRTNFHGYTRHYHLGLIEPLVAAYLRSLHNRTDGCFVPTRAMAARLQAQGFERLSVLGRGVDATRFAPHRRSSELRARWGVREGDPVLIHVGRLAAEKNIALVLRAYEAARAAQPRTRLVLVGDGPLDARLRRRHPDVIFAGVQRAEALAEHYASADVMVFASESETFGNVTLEALASSLAVVAFDDAAAGEHIVHGDTGWLVPRGAHGEFVRMTVAAALTPAAEAQALRRRARRRALELGWPDVLERFADQLALHADAARAQATRDVVLA